MNEDITKAFEANPMMTREFWENVLDEDKFKEVMRRASAPRGMYYDMDGNELDHPPEEMVATSREAFDRRRIGDTYLKHIRISTVFLGLNHQYMPDCPPLIFETMVFIEGMSGIFDRSRRKSVFDKGPRRDVGRVKGLDQLQLRWSTKEEARAGHERVVEMARSFNRTATRRERFRRYMRRRARKGH